MNNKTKVKILLLHGHLSRGLLNPQKPKTHILPNPQESKTPCQSLICPQLPLNLHERQSNWTQDREIEINWKKKEKEIEKSRGRGGPQAELMGVWVYKGVLDFRLRLKIKRRIGIFWGTYFIFLGIFVDFQREYLSAIVQLPRKWEKRKWHKFSLCLVSEKRQERTRKWMDFKIEKLIFFLKLNVELEFFNIYPKFLLLFSCHVSLKCANCTHHLPYKHFLLEG